MVNSFFQEFVNLVCHIYDVWSAPESQSNKFKSLIIQMYVQSAKSSGWHDTHSADPW